ncbi:unnamed protein product (macronuclear) [Paramecium tetraurelia]|uniref:CRC domain-containing protein n=1 Tax=Paramecium tetraurelia TaxID=5888 RepID=A0BKU4_PARTE|nr:uncharacterized protein GSPATT00029792001 [Paramecium tetraurelia]CAK59161.1 unnamed protein product [Paramecium tetraurelia]|eukprot:XP_001426559.1 hypothetical protein (macronuclear) [Paramecium tetraurelia strain d4-2]
MSGFFKQKQLNEYEFKTPKKVQQQQQENIQTIEEFGLKDSPLQFQNKSIQTLKNEQKLEEKVNKIIRRIKFDDDQLVIKKDQSIFRQKRTTNKEYKVNSSYTLDLINSIEIRRDNVIVNKLEKVQPSDHLQQQYQNIRNESITCRCKKTKCIKYYCECFQYGQECSFKCECTGCCNKQVKQSSGKMQLVSPTIEFQGCKCQKQNCSKKYCECLKRNQRCTDLCKCIDNCSNQLHQIKPQILDFSQLLSQFEDRT